MALLAVEIRRLLARRAVVLLLLACVVMPAVTFASIAWDTRPVSAADYAEAEKLAETERNSPWVREEIANCEKQPEMYGVSDVAECADMIGISAENFLNRRPLDLQEQRLESGTAVLIFVTLFLMLAATTFAGADWGSGSMSNQLLFEPRRGRVWLAKGVAVLLVSVTAAGTAFAAYWGGMTWLARSRDLAPPAAVIDQITSSALWGVGLVAGAAVGCYALTMLFRHTVATVGILFALAVGSSILIGLLPLSATERWLLPTNVLAFVHGTTPYYVYDTCSPTDMMCSGERTLSRGPASVYLGSLLVAALVLSVASFRRRDVP